MPTTQATQTPGKGRRWVKRIAKVMLIVLLSLATLLGLGIIGARLYFSDHRIKTMAEAEVSKMLKVSFTVADLDLGLCSGLELKGVKVGPPKGFERDVLTVGRVAASWSCTELLAGTLHLSEVGVEHLWANLEEKDGKRNIDVLIASLAQPTTEEPEAPQEAAPAEAGSDELKIPDIPIRVIVDDLHAAPISAHVSIKGIEAELKGLALFARAEAQGQSIDLWTWVGLGPGPEKTRSTERLAQTFDLKASISPPLAAMAAEVKATGSLGIEVTSTGLGAITTKISSDVDLHGKQDKMVLPKLRLVLGLDARADLLKQEAEAKSLAIDIGPGLTLTTRASASNILKDPSEHVYEWGATQLDGQLDKFQAWLKLVEPQSDLGGRLSFKLRPGKIKATAISAPASIDAQATLITEKLDARWQSAEVKNLDTQIDLTTESGTANITLDASTASVRYDDHHLAPIKVAITAESPILPWLGGEIEPGLDQLQSEMKLSLLGYNSKLANLGPIHIRLKANGSTAVLNGKAGQPLVVALNTQAKKFSGFGQKLGHLEVKLGAKVRSLSPLSVDTDLEMTASRLVSGVGKGTVTVKEITLDSKVDAGDDRYHIKSFRLVADKLVDLMIAGKASRVTSPAPRLTNLRVMLSPTDVKTLLDVLPPDLRPALTATGKLAINLQAHGTVPWKKLMAQTKVPELDLSSTAAAGASVPRLVTFLDGWTALFRKRLPFESELGVIWTDGKFESPDAAFEFDEITLSVGVTPRGPRAGMTLKLPEVTVPVQANDITTRLEFSFFENDIQLVTQAAVGRLQSDALHKPIEQLNTDLDLSYRVGGDFRIKKFETEAKSHVLKVELSGLIAKPTRVVENLAWTRRGLPGLEAQASWSLSTAPKTLEPVYRNGPQLQGLVKTTGSMSIASGLATLSGDLSVEEMTMVVGDLIVEEANGKLPVTATLAFEPKENATRLPVALGFGGDYLALVTSPQDIRLRPAKPPHYDRIVRYRKRPTLSISSIVSGQWEIFDFELDGRLADGILSADRIAMQLLGGDIVGEMALQLGRNKEIVTQLDLKVSNIDAGNFEALNLKPGPDSELSADFALSFLAAPSRRDLTLSMNVTKIGEEAFDRFLQSVDPKEEDSTIQDYRSYLGFIDINSMAVWVRYENLNADLDYTMLIPALQPLPKNLLRRYSLSGFLDVYLQPILDRDLAPALGWPVVAPKSEDKAESLTTAQSPKN